LKEVASPVSKYSKHPIKGDTIEAQTKRQEFTAARFHDGLPLLASGNVTAGTKIGE
jgi:hypothetical protein